MIVPIGCNIATTRTVYIDRMMRQQRIALFSAKSDLDTSPRRARVGGLLLLE